MLAHPDDEVLALGGRLERFERSRFLTVTDGAPTNGADARDHGFETLGAYRQARRAELLAAFSHAGLSADLAAAFPGQVADQQATFHMASLARTIAADIEQFQPEAILTHPYEGGHPDHDACAFAVHAAVSLLGQSTPIFEAPFYHAGASGSMRTGTFLANGAGTLEVVCPLSAAEQEHKRLRLGCFASQTSTLAQFSVSEERFRLAPAYDFTQSPHQGKLLYEHFPWGMDGVRFRSLAADAIRELFGGLPHCGDRAREADWTAAPCEP